MRGSIFLLFLLIFLINQCCFSYALPENYTDHPWLKMVIQSDRTYQAYINHTGAWINIYHTEPNDLQYILGQGCNDDTLSIISFTYKDSVHYPEENIFVNRVSNQFSIAYPSMSYICPDHYNLMASTNNENYPVAVFIHPIFKSQPKVWIVIQREFKTWFPGAPGTESDFLKNGDLKLVLTVTDSRWPEADKTETLPIDYTIFNKPVKTPTCYSLPLDHKLRPCTATEAKLRSPALKVFLGEA